MLRMAVLLSIGREGSMTEEPRDEILWRLCTTVRRSPNH